MRPWYRFIRWVFRNFFIRPLGRFKVIGAENVPVSGPVLFAPIHVSHFDPPVVACASPRETHFMAKEELFKPPVFGPLIRSLGAFPVKRGQNDTESIRRAIDILKSGHGLLVFPEGTRGDGETMLPITPGVSMLAKKTGAKVVPVGIIGTHVVLPKGRSKLRRSPITVVFGPAQTYDEMIAGAEAAQVREAFVEKLGQMIADACRAGGLDIKTALSTELGSPSLAGEKATEGSSPGAASTPTHP